MITKKYYKLIRVSYADEGYFCITNVSNTIGNVNINTVASSTSNNPNYEYSTDGVTWNTYNVKGTNVQVDPNSNIYWRYAGSGTKVGNTSNYYFGFYVDFDCYISGNLMSLYSKTDFANYTGTWNAYYLFYNQTHVLKAEFNLGTVTTIPEDGFRNMFNGCTGLTTGPDLSSITSIGKNGMGSMYSGCSALTTAPNLINVTSAGSGAVLALFNGCSSLTTAYAPTITWDGFSTSYNWLSGVAASGTLYADSSIASSIPTNNASGCPSGWTVVSV